MVGNHAAHEAAPFTFKGLTSLTRNDIKVTRHSALLKGGHSSRQGALDLVMTSLPVLKLQQLRPFSCASCSEKWGFATTFKFSQNFLAQAITTARYFLMLSPRLLHQSTSRGVVYWVG